MKVKKRILWGVFGFILGFVIADYLEFFPTLYKDYGMSLPFTFEFVDSVDGTPVDGVVVNATYKDVDVINKYHDVGGGTVYVLARGGGFGYKQTFFFKKPSPRRTIKRINEKEIDFTFQHPLYKTYKKTLSKGKRGEIYTVKLIPIDSQTSP
ncbi:MAG: hypothetical protein ACYSPI_12185 [Planctomycetota bacterium]|jgi:hypothetical protein